jgi:hypothetical protein
MHVDLEELDGIIDGALRAPLSESDGRKLKTALHAMAEKLLGQRTTERPRLCCRSRGASQLSSVSMPIRPNLRRRVTGATALAHSRAPRGSPSGMRHSNPEIHVSNVAPGKCTGRKSRKPWCASSGRRLCKRLFWKWSVCGAMVAGSCSPRPNRKEWDRRSTTPLPRRRSRNSAMEAAYPSSWSGCKPTSESRYRQPRNEN